MTEWFRRLAAIPDVGYATIPQVDRETLPGHDAEPRIYVYVTEGNRRETLIWPTQSGSTSASPAAAYSNEHLSSSAATSDVLLQRLREALELPGTVSDYHFAIQRCLDELWKRRWQEPALLPEVESLCWLDIRLVEARPEAIASPGTEGSSYFRVLAFGQLVDLYRGEGFLTEALEVADRGLRLGQEMPVEELRERHARMAAEEP